MKSFDTIKHTLFGLATFAFISVFAAFIILICWNNSINDLIHIKINFVQSLFLYWLATTLANKQVIAKNDL